MLSDVKLKPADESLTCCFSVLDVTVLLGTAEGLVEEKRCRTQVLQLLRGDLGSLTCLPLLVNVVPRLYCLGVLLHELEQNRIVLNL
jgi:hypothetical protein